MTGADSGKCTGDFAEAIGIADGVCSYLDERGTSDITAGFAAVAVVSRICMVVARGDVLAAQKLIDAVAETARMEALNLANGGRA